MKVAVCIPAMRTDTVKPCITSIQRQTWPDWELVVVGQGNDGAVRTLTESIASVDQRVRYVHIATPGASRARNAGIAATDAAIVAFIDDDCEAHPEWLATVTRCFIAEPDLGVVSGSVVAPAYSGWFVSCPEVAAGSALYDPVASGRRAPEEHRLMGANFALRRSAIEQVGRLDEHLGPGEGGLFPGGEDVDYVLRLEAQGVKMRSTPESVVYHTYGVRRGPRALLRLSKSYARGAGAVAAKLTLLGDPRGREWLDDTRREYLTDLRQRLRSGRIPPNPLRMWHFTRAYRECLRRYDANTHENLLVPREMSASGIAYPRRSLGLGD